jgi:hypothetical protein
VSLCLREQGYFIGTIIDGDMILKGMKGGDKYEGYADNNDGTEKKVIFSLGKIPDIDYSVLSTGNKIMSYFETFQSAYPENLVSIEYLAAKAAEYDLKLVESRSFLEEPGNLLAEYMAEDPKSEIINKIPALQAWSEMNRYFIFQKVRSEE